MRAKSIIKFTLFIVVVCSWGVVLTSCIDPISQKRAYWERYIDSLDKSCPITIDNSLSVSGIKMNHDTIEISYKVNEEYYPLSIMKTAYKKNENDMKVTKFITFADNIIDSNHKLEDIISMNASIKEHITGNSPSESLEFFINPDEIRNLSKVKYTENERNFLRLKCKIIGESCRCPYSIEDGMYMENVSLNRDYVTFQIKVDERLYPIDAFYLAKEEIKMALKEEMLNTPLSILYGDMIVLNKCNLGIRFMYVGNSSGKSITIIFKNNELPPIEDVQKAINKNMGIKVFK